MGDETGLESDRGKVKNGNGFGRKAKIELCVIRQIFEAAFGWFIWQQVKQLGANLIMQED